MPASDPFAALAASSRAFSLTRRACGLSAAPLGRAAAPPAHALAHPGRGHLPSVMAFDSVMLVCAGSGDTFSLTAGSLRPAGHQHLQRVFRDHFASFAADYDARYAKELGNFRIERISRVATRFLTCGDYRQGVARIRCSNPECRLEYFRPFSCRGFHLCPSCSQKRSLLFSEYLDEQLLLALPHRMIECFSSVKSSGERVPLSWAVG